jgi:hypothetical protein
MLAIVVQKNARRVDGSAFAEATPGRAIKRIGVSQRRSKPNPQI